MKNRPIWHAASRLVKAYGQEAPAQASRRARDLLEIGEIDRRRSWLRIMRATETLVQTELRKD
jgi:hypothetical protein